MDDHLKASVQQRVAAISVLPPQGFQKGEGVEDGFLPWRSDLSPSALYNCSLGCRKRAGLKAPEVKWISIKRWMTTSPEHGIRLPEGVFLSIRRKESFVPYPAPRIQKVEYLIVMLPFGNVWSQRASEVPIDEPWLWELSEGRLILEHLVARDSENPLPGYFRSCKDFATANPEQIGIHLKRKKTQAAT